jgi:hypothetical protein
LLAAAAIAILPRLSLNPAMSTASAGGPARLSLWGRLLLGAVAAGALGLLVTAACLQPSPAGFGTHRQLGLPDCTFKVVFGHRCPSCGMTTSWSYLMRGRILSSVRANAGGTWLGILTAVFAPWVLAAAVAGRWPGPAISDRVMVGLAMSVVGITVVDWIVRWGLNGAT